MNLLYLIKYLLNCSKYTKYRRYIKLNKEDKEIYFLYKSLDKLIDTYKRDITLDEFSLYILTSLGNDYRPLLSIIEEGSIQDEIIEDTLKTIRERTNAYELAQLALEVSEGKKSYSDLLDFVSNSEDKHEEPNQDPFVTTSTKQLLSKTVDSIGLRWRLNRLNESLGSLRNGNFGFLFARPETGKTCFLSSEATFWANQASAPVLWFNNEETGEAVALRCVMAALGKSIEEIKEDPEQAEKDYLEITKGNLKIVDSANLYKSFVQHLIKEYKPAIVIFDQIDKIKGFDGDRDDLRLGTLYQWARELAKQYCPVIGVCQADGTGEGKKWLTMDNVANSKTSKQAEADFIIGIGKTHDPGLENIRYFNISKNKLPGDVDSNPTMRHGKFEALIRGNIQRYSDI